MAFGVTLVFIGQDFIAQTLQGRFHVRPPWTTFLLTLFGGINGGVSFIRFYFPARLENRLGSVSAAAVGSLVSFLTYEATFWNEGFLLGQSTVIVQSAEYIGSFGLTFFPLLVNWDLAKAMCRPKFRIGRICAVVLLLVAIGYFELNFQGDADSFLNVLSVRLLPVGRDTKSKPQAATTLNDIMLESSESALQKAQFLGEPELIAWPESAAYDLNYTGEGINRAIASFASKHQISILYNSNRRVFSHENLGRRNFEMTNSNILVGPQGQKNGQYDKVSLAPFGEKLPWALDFGPLRETLDKQFNAGNRYKPGTTAYPLEMVKGTKIGSSICFDVFNPAISRQLTAAGAGVLVNLTNTEAFLNSSLPAIMSLQLRLRAVENHRSSLLVNLAAPSSGFDTRGLLISQTIIDQDIESSNVKMPISKQRTFFNQYGNWFLLLQLLWIGGVVAVKIRLFGEFTMQRRRS